MRRAEADIAAVRDRLLYDTPFWAANCATIIDPQRRPVKLHPRPWQARTPETPAHVRPLDEALEDQRARGVPMRAVILKARKLGFSTWVQAKAMQRVTQLPFQYALSVAHIRASASVLFDMGALMWERLPSDPMLAELLYGRGTTRPAPFSVRPQRVAYAEARNGARYMVFGDKARPSEVSLYETLTAGAKGGGRASTPSIIHGSEVAHWEDPNYLDGLMNAMPLEPETIAVLESTANGFNHFEQVWSNAVAGAVDPLTGVIWTPLFYGWQDNQRNALGFLTPDARLRFERTVGDPDGGGDKEEVELVSEYGVTLEQLAWRRAVLMGPECRGSIEKFHQEHPATPEQAFIGSGKPVFPGLLVSRAIKKAKDAPAPVEGVLRPADMLERRTRAGSILVPQRAEWVPESDIKPADADRWGLAHRLAVWEHPVNEATESVRAPKDRRVDGQYVVFADVAVGDDGTGGGGDWHAIQVLEHVRRVQVARYRSRIPVHDLPLVLLMIGLYYNEAWIAPEVNGPGIGVVDALAKDYRYRYLYRRHRAGDDERADARERLLGWMTDLRTKPLMEQTFGQALGEGTHGLRCVLTGREATTYVQDPKNPAKHGAQKGANDDLLMAFMGAHRVAAELRPRDLSRKRGGRAGGPRDPVTGW